MATVPRTLVGRDADAYFEDEPETFRALADTVAASVESEIDPSSFQTPNERFNGEWAMGTHQMTALGLSQVVSAQPHLRARYLPAINGAVERLLRADTYQFARAAWQHGPFDDLEHGEGHAYLGYVALALGSLRELDPDTEHAAMHDRLIDALVRRMQAHPLGVVQTYPGEAYPCDLAAIVGAVALHARLTGVDRRHLLTHMARVFRTHFIDADSGYVVQSLRSDSTPLDAPRASGTALAAYFWSFADPMLEPSVADELDRVLLDRGLVTHFGFGGVMEYAPGHEGTGDIDSGPVVHGVSVSGTGFALAAARRQRDTDAFAALYRTAALFGVPIEDDEQTHFLTGGPLGNAIMLAMLTARRS
jgi:hypothetical protein